MMNAQLFLAVLLLASAGSAASRMLAQTSPSPSPAVVIAPGSDNLTATNQLANATGGELPVVPPTACDNTKSPSSITITSGRRFTATLSGLNNIKPNTTGIATPVNGSSKGTYTLLVDETGKRATWTLELCDVPEYVAAHLHTGSASADYPPPLIPLEPYVKPANPFAPPNLLPQLCPPVNITGCSYVARGSFSDADITPLLGREPTGDREVPSVRNFAEFLTALKAGKIYANIHSKLAPGNLIRGNLESVPGSSSGAAPSPKPGNTGGGSGNGGSTTDTSPAPGSGSSPSLNDSPSPSPTTTAGGTSSPSPSP